MPRPASFVCVCGRKPKVGHTFHTVAGTSRNYNCACGKTIETLETIQKIRPTRNYTSRGNINHAS